MDSVALWFDEEDCEHERIQWKIVRDKSNIMELSDKSFVTRSSSSTNTINVNSTYNKIRSDTELSWSRRTPTSNWTRPPRSHRNFEMSVEEINEAKKHFFLKSSPGVIAAIDGTHIQIRPSTSEHLLFNRKLKHRMNAMVICDHKLSIRAVNGRYGGASHDSHVWSLSNERQYLRQNFENGNRSSWIIGDSGYPLEPWLLMPYRNAPENSLECNFNQQFSKARSTIERVFGILKGRSRCLLAARELHYAPEKVVQILNVCCALHNVCLIHNIEPPTDIPTETQEVAINTIYQTHNLEDINFSNIAQRIRDEIKNSLMVE